MIGDWLLLTLLLGSYFLVHVAVSTEGGFAPALDAFTSLPYIHLPNTKQYTASTVLANAACSSLCPQMVALPASDIDVAHVVLLCGELNITLAIRGGGHGYTCQAVKDGGILLDTRALNHLEINEDKMHMTVGSGLVWDDILPHLRKKGLSVVHGQCTSVGVSGFSLHGGVHFGGLSELYGLASDNILSLKAVIANGSMVELTNSSCYMNARRVDYHECNGLWFSLRGAGSSFAVVTELTIQLHRLPSTFKSSLSIFQVMVSSSTNASRYIDIFINSVPSEVSLTFFGLDAYFKAFLFVLKFIKSNERKRALYHGMSRLLGTKTRKGSDYVYFVVEATWVAEGDDGGNDDIYGDKIGNLLSKIHDKIVQGNSYAHGDLAIDMPLPFLYTDRTWSVPSYDLVWGSGHAYGGASITTGAAGSESVLQALMQRFHSHLMLSRSSKTAASHCSDCVVVLHRVGDGLASRTSSSSSFNPLRTNSTLWAEVDCGLFYRKLRNWPMCSRWIDDTQLVLDQAVEKRNHSAFHYPNVPNLVTENWGEMYYGKDTYNRLLEEKRIWDKKNLFNHVQSIGSAQRKKDIINNDLIEHAHLCNKAYKWRGLRDLRLGITIISGFFFLRSIYSGARRLIHQLLTSRKCDTSTSSSM